MHWSDDLHLELCTGFGCHAMKPRSEMKRKPGGRAWFCERCYKQRFGNLPKNPDEAIQNKLF